MVVYVSVSQSTLPCALDAARQPVEHAADPVEDELRSRITRTDLANGFANRFLFALVRRSKELPFGGSLTDSEILRLGECLRTIEPHLRAALAAWEYCEASAAHIFGNSLGDPIADEIERALKQQFSEGMTRTAIRDLFKRINQVVASMQH
jgi:hypothetical protein